MHHLVLVSPLSPVRLVSSDRGSASVRSSVRTPSMVEVKESGCLPLLGAVVVVGVVTAAVA